MLETQAAWAGKRVVVIDRFFPSSKQCGFCGAVNATLTLGERVWTCPTCQRVLDRDHNAAQKIRHAGLRMLAVGRTESQNAGGVAVRPATAGR